MPDTAVLRQTILDVRDVLLENKKYVDKDVLDLAEQTMVKLKTDPLIADLLKSALNVGFDKIDKLLAAADAAIRVERKLVETDLTDRIVKKMTSTANSSLALNAIALLLGD